MMDEKRLREVIRSAVLMEMGGKGLGGSDRAEKKTMDCMDVSLGKRVMIWMGGEIPPPPMMGTFKPIGNRDFYLSRTLARLAVGRCGTRLKTKTLLDFLADHACARDAVHSHIEKDIIEKLGMIEISSAAKDRREFLLRPDLGRRLSPESLSLVQQKGIRSPQVQIVVADGLSATAINTNIPILLPILIHELSGIKLGTVFAVKNGRVACGDEIGRTVGADIVCMIVGERPGLKSAESVGVYVTYVKVKDFNEAMRTVISNIHANGLIPEEGAKQVAYVCKKALKEKKTGLS